MSATSTDQRPTPDPTILTTEQLLREVDRVKELMVAMIQKVEAVFAEKLVSVETQFSLIERQRVEQKTDTATAVQAALSAAKEAVKEQTLASEKSIAKSEKSVTDQLGQLNTTFDTAIKGVGNILDDLKERVGKVETARESVHDYERDDVTRRHMKAGVRSVDVAMVAILVTITISILTMAIATHGFTR